MTFEPFSTLFYRCNGRVDRRDEIFEIGVGQLGFDVFGQGRGLRRWCRSFSSFLRYILFAMFSS
jgi:hypothetical protein